MMFETPFFLHISNSVAFIRRDAVAISGWLAPTPAQNNLIPAPVPVDSMIGDLNCGFLFLNCSATAVAKG